jgi:hypothetical protein
MSRTHDHVVTFVTEVSLYSREVESQILFVTKFRGFSENLSVLFPSALVTIAEGSSRREKQLDFSCPHFCDYNFQSQKGNFTVIQYRGFSVGYDESSRLFLYLLSIVTVYL